MPSNVILPMVPTATPAMPSVAAVALCTVEVTPQWLLEWQGLEDRLQSRYLACSAVWTRIWLQHYGDLVPHRIAVLTLGGQIAGMCLLTDGVAEREGPFPIRSLHIGTAGEPESESICVEYNRLLTTPARQPQFAKQLMQTVWQREPYECFAVDGMHEDDALTFLEQGPPAELEKIPSYYCDLNAIRNAPSEPWRLFGESTRTNLRRSLRDLGEVDLDWSETADRALDYYDEMVGYHQQRWNAAGKPGVFASERFREFHRDLIAALVPQQRAVLVRARQGSRVLGVLYVLIEGRRLLYYQAGLPEHQSKLSLGNVTQYLTMLEGSRRGYDAFDFMAGDAQYKRVLSTHQNMLYWAQWRKPCLKFMVLNGLRSLKNRFKRSS